MDAAFLPFLIGGLVSLGGTFLANYFTLRREREQWERQQRVESKKLEREEDQRSKEQLLAIYSNCIRSLSQFMHFDDGNTYSGEEFSSLPKEERKRFYDERAKHFVEAQHWLWLLSINLKDVEDDDLKRFNEDMRLFVKNQFIGELHEIVLKFARNDSRLKSYTTHVAELTSANFGQKIKELPNA